MMADPSTVLIFYGHLSLFVLSYQTHHSVV